MKKGKLIVIEGTDGSGKTTQLELVIKELKKKDIATAVFDFPQYEKTFFGKFVKRFLTGEFGGLSEIDPYLASFPYAFDRWQAGDEIRKELKEGKIVLCNRYTGSSVAHQMAKLPLEKQEVYLNWVVEMEFKVLKTPEPDIVIFLHVDSDISNELLSKRNHLTGRQRDIAEVNLEYQKETEKIYLELVKKFSNWVMVECVKDNKIRSIEDIHKEIVAILLKKYWF